MASELPTSDAPARRRRRRPRRPSRRGMASLLPQLFTTGNLAAGFYAIVKASQGDFGRACVALIVAGAFSFRYLVTAPKPLAMDNP